MRSCNVAGSCQIIQTNDNDSSKFEFSIEMTDYIVAEFVNSVDSIILLPIQQTQRIKYTAYDVSDKYIIFGASSGGLYIFNRHPCSFMKLIPSTEGAVVNLSISNDEKIVGVATSRGTLCLFDNDNNSRNIQVFHEHLGYKITAMKWNYNSSELYCGDEAGKISVIVTNFITKTVFQSPSATLMQLDSRIVQLDWGFHFLLVSTLTRCYLCDTKSEHYRQIGKKMREGEFGGCFLGNKFTSIPSERKAIGKFNILNDKDSFVMYDGSENIKLFCARPGARVWEVQLNGTVIRTHQFKKALTNGNNIIALSDTDGRLIFMPKNESSFNGHNFTKLLIFNNYILTYKKDGLYILDPQNVAVIFWTDYYTDIIDLKIIKNFIYVWTSTKMHVLLFSTLENFIIKSLLNKMYLLCADLCILYQNQLKKILPQSNKLYLLSCLNEKLRENNPTLLEEAQPILNAIKELTVNRKAAQKLSSGIFVVDNAHFVNKTNDNHENPPETNEVDVTNKNKKLALLFENKTNDNHEQPPETIEVNVKNNKNKKLALLFEEYELNQINSHFRTTILDTAFNSAQLFEITDLFSEFPHYFNCDTNNIWCFNTCLNYIYNNIAKFAVRDIETNNYLKQAFITVNSNCQYVCACKFPLPEASKVQPKYYQIGKIINNNNICDQVPYMYRETINSRQNEPITNLLSLIIQYGDVTIFNYFSTKFTYDIWAEILKKYVFLQSNKCLNCEKTIVVNYLGITWRNLATEMVKTIGAESTIRLLSENSENIPKGELDASFYQCCIFSTLVDNMDRKLRHTAVKFVTESSCMDNNFGKLLEKTLQSKEINFSVNITANNCLYCCMPLQTPVLCKEKTIELKCGHFYHNICFKRRNNVCIICSS